MSAIDGDSSMQSQQQLLSPPNLPPPCTSPRTHFKDIREETYNRRGGRMTKDQNKQLEAALGDIAQVYGPQAAYQAIATRFSHHATQEAWRQKMDAVFRDRLLTPKGRESCVVALGPPSPVYPPPLLSSADDPPLRARLSPSRRTRTTQPNSPSSFSALAATDLAPTSQPSGLHSSEPSCWPSSSRLPSLGFSHPGQDEYLLAENRRLQDQNALLLELVEGCQAALAQGEDLLARSLGRNKRGLEFFKALRGGQHRTGLT